MASTVHDFTTGEVLTAALVESWLQPLGAMKTANEAVTSSATLQNDNHLALALEANAVYALSMFLNITSNTTADFRFDFTGPASFGYRGVSYSVNATTSDIREVDGISDTVPPMFGTTNRLFVYGHVDTAGTAGTLQLRWAQGTSDAGATTVLANSYLTLQRVG